MARYGRDYGRGLMGRGYDHDFGRGRGFFGGGRGGYDRGFMGGGMMGRGYDRGFRGGHGRGRMGGMVREGMHELGRAARRFF